MYLNYFYIELCLIGTNSSMFAAELHHEKQLKLLLKTSIKIFVAAVKNDAAVENRCRLCITKYRVLTL